jgi:hypothetical protein
LPLLYTCSSRRRPAGTSRSAAAVQAFADSTHWQRRLPSPQLTLFSANPSTERSWNQRTGMSNLQGGQPQVDGFVGLAGGWHCLASPRLQALCACCAGVRAAAACTCTRMQAAEAHLVTRALLQKLVHRAWWPCSCHLAMLPMALHRDSGVAGESIRLTAYGRQPPDAGAGLVAPGASRGKQLVEQPWRSQQAQFHRAV